MILERGHCCLSFSNVFFRLYELQKSQLYNWYLPNNRHKQPETWEEGFLFVMEYCDIHFITYIHDFMELFKCRGGDVLQFRSGQQWLNLMALFNQAEKGGRHTWHGVDQLHMRIIGYHDEIENIIIIICLTQSLSWAYGLSARACVISVWE